MKRGPVYNIEDIAHDCMSIIKLYNSRGYSILFDPELGMDPKTPGILVVPITVTRVGKIAEFTDGIITNDSPMRIYGESPSPAALSSSRTSVPRAGASIAF